MLKCFITNDLIYLIRTTLAYKMAPTTKFATKYHATGFAQGFVIMDEIMTKVTTLCLLQSVANKCSENCKTFQAMASRTLSLLPRLPLTHFLCFPFQPLRFILHTKPILLRQIPGVLPRESLYIFSAVHRRV